MNNKADKPKLDINAVLNAAENDKSGKTFHGADKKAEELANANKKPVGRKKKEKSEKDKQIGSMYFSPAEFEELEKARIELGIKSKPKYIKEVILQVTKVINGGGTNKLLLLGLLNEK